MSIEELITTDIRRAVSALQSGGLVAMPTETVYALAADAGNVSAVARIFAVKGRPASHPLILHLGSIADLGAWAAEIPGYAWRLGEYFWPGPLTLLLRRRPGQSYRHFSGDQPFVTIRVPGHHVALALIAANKRGVAAPSANRFGRVSPTAVAHVVEEIGSALIPGKDVILDGGPSSVGIESTILDCTEDAPVILRPGAIGPLEIKRIGGVEVSTRTSGLRAPGTLASHYAPRAKVVVADEPDGILGTIEASRVTADARVTGAADGPSTGLLALASVQTPVGAVRLAAPVDEAEYARCLYAALRQADSLKLSHVVAIPPPGDGIGIAIRDRLRRASFEIQPRP